MMGPEIRNLDFGKQIHGSSVTVVVFGTAVVRGRGECSRILKKSCIAADDRSGD